MSELGLSKATGPEHKTQKNFVVMTFFREAGGDSRAGSRESKNREPQVTASHTKCMKLDDCTQNLDCRSAVLEYADKTSANTCAYRARTRGGCHQNPDSSTVFAITC